MCFVFAAIVCTNLTAPTNGRIVYSSDTTSPYDFGTEATYECDIGFGISQGDRMRTCGGFGSSTEGMWSGDAASCQRECPLNPVLKL